MLLHSDATGYTQAGYHKWLKGKLDPSLRVQYDPFMYYMTATFRIPEHLRDQIPIPGGFSTPRWLYTCYPDTDIEPRVFIMGIMENSQRTFSQTSVDEVAY